MRPNTACFWKGILCLELLSDNDTSSLVVDVVSQMARLVAKTLRMCSGLVILTYCTCYIGAVTGEVSFHNYRFLELRVVFSTVSLYPDSDS